MEMKVTLCVTRGGCVGGSFAGVPRGCYQVKFVFTKTQKSPSRELFLFLFLFFPVLNSMYQFNIEIFGRLKINEKRRQDTQRIEHL